MADISELIRRVNAGEADAREALFAAAYGELRTLARSRLYRGGRNTYLDTTALVHESYLRFVQSGQLRSQDRGAFFLYAARVMRAVIVDSVRRHQALRRGAGQEHVTLNTSVQDPEQAAAEETLHLHHAIDQLARVEPLLAEVVEMRYFGGYSEAEIAVALGVTERTVRRYWHKARALLSVMLET